MDGRNYCRHCGSPAADGCPCEVREYLWDNRYCPTCGEAIGLHRDNLCARCVADHLGHVVDGLAPVLFTQPAAIEAQRAQRTSRGRQ
jgi:hypothetical protein